MLHTKSSSKAVPKRECESVPAAWEAYKETTIRYTKQRTEVAQKAKDPHTMPTGLRNAPPPLRRLTTSRTAKMIDMA